MRRILIRRLLPFVFLCVVLTVTIQADDVTDEITSSIDSELSMFIESLPDYVKDFFPKESLNGDPSYILNGKINEKSFLDAIISYLFFGIDKALSSFGSILALLIISSILNTAVSSFSSTNVTGVFSICSTLCVSLTVFKLCSDLAALVTSYMKILCDVMNTFTPVMTAMYIMSGNITSATVSATSMVLFISLIDVLLVSSIIPLVKFSLALTCVKASGTGCDFSGITKTLKTTYTSVTVFIMSIFMFVLSFKNILSQSVDSLSMKTAKFAISSIVPIVGSSINEALRTVTSSLSLIKNSCGVIAIISIAILMLPIIINLFLNKLSFNLLASLAKLIGCNNESGVLDEADSICGFLLALVCCGCVLFIFAITIFIKTGVYVGA